MKKNFLKNKGQSLVEILMAIGISAILLPALITGLFAGRNGKAQEIQRLRSVELMKETEEAVRIVREDSWNNIATVSSGLAYHPVISGSTWSLSQGAETIGSLTRQVIFDDVYRSTASGAIISDQNGWLDTSTRKATVSVSWSNPFITSINSVFYITHFTPNTEKIWTTLNDFTTPAPTQTGTVVVYTAGSATDGEITLGAGNGVGGDWCKPGVNVLKTFNLPGNGVTTSISATTSSNLDYAYTTTGGNASGDSVDGVNIDHNIPPNITNPDNNNEAKAYGIYVDRPNGHVFFAENRPPNHTVRIANTNTLANQGYYDSSGGGTGTSVYELGTIGFVTVGSMLYTFDTGTINGSSSQAELGSANLSANGMRVIAVKDPSTGTIYAYVAESSSTKQLEIFQINSNGSIVASPVANAQISNAAAGQDIYVNSDGSRVYLVTSQYSAGQNQFFIINTTSKSGTLPAPIGGFSTYTATMSAGMNPKGVTVVPGNRAIVVGSGAIQYQVYNIATENNIKSCGGMLLPGNVSVNAISSIVRDDKTAYSYILTSDSSNEFQVILGGNGGQYSLSGTYESSTFATSSANITYNRFFANIAQPANTTLKLQTAVGIQGNCNNNNFTYVGPNGDPTQYFTSTDSATITGIVPIATIPSYYNNPGYCFRYKAWFSTTDNTSSPILYDMSLNFSP